MAALHAHTPLHALDPHPLSEASEILLRRARVFLFGISRPANHVAALMAGYTPEIHRDGVFNMSVLSGERPFCEWREWRALRPPRDPELPEEIARLEAFVDTWMPRARAAAQLIEDCEDRREVLGYLEDSTYMSRTWRAKSLVQRLEGLKEDTDFYAPVWNALREQGFEKELELFNQVLETVQHHIRSLPLDEAEMDDIHQSREQAAGSVGRWLDERRTQLAAFGELELTILGLGEVIPPPGFEPSVRDLAEFKPVASA